MRLMYLPIRPLGELAPAVAVVTERAVLRVVMVVRLITTESPRVPTLAECKSDKAAKAEEKVQRRSPFLWTSMLPRPSRMPMLLL